jgi:hypothetical protein
MDSAKVMLLLAKFASLGKVNDVRNSTLSYASTPSMEWIPKLLAIAWNSPN